MRDFLLLSLRQKHFQFSFFHFQLEIRRATGDDLPRLMELYDAARAFMRRSGNHVQWVGGYPSREMVAAGIAAGEQWVCLSGGHIAATFWFAVGPEPTYAEITDGPGWLECDAPFETAPYGVVHRLASDGSVSGVGAECLEWCFAQCGNIRVDTHACNTVMQNLLTRLGYTRRGVIRIADGTPRDAFQKKRSGFYSPAHHLSSAIVTNALPES
jgi:hypothetical protein